MHKFKPSERCIKKPHKLLFFSQKILTLEPTHSHWFSNEMKNRNLSHPKTSEKILRKFLSLFKYLLIIKQLRNTGSRPNIHIMNKGSKLSIYKWTNTFSSTQRKHKFSYQQKHFPLSLHHFLTLDNAL
jgi:hypothetical protein